MAPRGLFILIVLFAGLVRCDNYGPVLRAIDDMIAREEQRQHMVEHAKGVPHSNDLGRLPHDYAYTDDYSVKDLVDGVAYVDQLSGKGKPTLPVFTDSDKSDFTRVDVPSAELSNQQRLHQQLTAQQERLANHRKDQQLKQQALSELLAEEERLKNPLNGLPTFTTNENGTDVAFVQECSANMPNGIPCPGGRCQNGKCKQDQKCYDDCCLKTVNGTERQPNGEPCKGGNCLDGRCRAYPVCIGECCTGTNNDVAKPNGTPCEQGHCHEGGCKSDVGCTRGQCCNMHQNRLYPKGFPCHVSSCQEKAFCSGASAFCPEEEPKADDSVCPGGFCKSGVCAKSGVVAANSTAKLCDEGICCDVDKGTYLAKGTPCSNNPCADGGACSGLSGECSASARPAADGKACPGGRCRAGSCVAVAMCDAASECCANGVLLADYSVCTGGRCFQGACVVDVPCVGDCCKPHNGTGVLARAPNGQRCGTLANVNSTDVCVDGRCAATPLCVGDCCAAAGVRADGTPCGAETGRTSGRCAAGMCVDLLAPCTNGTCCDEAAGVLRPAGYACRAGPCGDAMACTGSSPFCPVSPRHAKDGTPCPQNGKCAGGVCVLPPKHVPDCTDGPCCDDATYKFKLAGVLCGNETCRESTFCTGSSALCPVTLNLLPDGTVCKLTDKAATDWTCQDGVCRQPAPVASTATVDIDLTRAPCNVTSACCNTQIQRVRARGFVCSVAQTPCMRDVTCDGETPRCTPAVLEDGSACPGGSCVHGFCVKGLDPTDTESVHEVHIHVVPKATAKDGETPAEALASQLLADEDEDELDEEEGSEPMEELMTIITRDVDGKVTERQMRLPLNALEKAKRKSLGLAGESVEKAEAKLAEKAAKIEAEARARIAKEKEAEKAKNAKNATATSSSSGAANATATNSTSTATNSTGATNTTTTTTTAATNTTTAANRTRGHGSEMSSAIRDFTEAYPMPTAGVVDPLTGVVRLTSGERGCASGACCDKAAGVFYTRGFQCATPKNLCRMAACSGYSTKCHVMDRPNGAACPGGNCYEGVCIKACTGECCDHHNLPRPNGAACAENSYCYEGVCVAKCEGECCNEHSFSRPDGANCTNGYCFDGKCLQTRDNMGAEAKHEAGRAGIEEGDDEYYNSIPLYTHEPPRNMEEEWSKMSAKQEEEKEREREVKRADERREAELKKAQATTAENVASQASLRATAIEKSEQTMKYVLYASGGVVGLLVIVAIIVAVVASRRKKAAKKDFDEYYDKF